MDSTLKCLDVHKISNLVLRASSLLYAKSDSDLAKRREEALGTRLKAFSSLLEERLFCSIVWISNSDDRSVLSYNRLCNVWRTLQIFQSTKLYSTMLTLRSLTICLSSGVEITTGLITRGGETKISDGLFSAESGWTILAENGLHAQPTVMTGR